MKTLLSSLPHPMQPIGYDQDDVIRFKRNAIVRFLLDWASERGMTLNSLASIPFADEDREQFAQLIGYSVSGFGELGYTRIWSVAKADEEASRIAKENVK